MALSREKARVKIMTILYQISLYKKAKLDIDVDYIINENECMDDLFVLEVVRGVVLHDEEIEAIANKYLKNWTLNRLGLTDQAIIKMGIYEIMYTDTPSKVCIDEAINLAHDYSDDSVVGMINSVLDRVYHNESNN